MLLAVLSGFLLAIFAPHIYRGLRDNSHYLITLLPLSLFIYFFSFSEEVAAGQPVEVVYSWVSSLGVDLVFRLDGLALLFTLLITGVGTLVFYYAGAYMKGYPNVGRFYAYLLMFMASMIGLVLSDNIISMFIFWELTSITSFFLIGFNNESEASRKSALQALAITGFGGLALLIGLIVLGMIGETYRISELADMNSWITQHGLYPVALVFIFLGAFTKSAQFPFHFWLPGAMKAPTPVSTYLHSATMVKAGVFLLMRLNPSLGGHEYWNYTLIAFGGFTMLYAAFHSLFKTDMKAVLAYSTVSALGILVFLIGIGTSEAISAAVLFVLVHAMYKATLFLVTGIVDHETKSRDISKLAGLRKIMPIVAVISFIAVLSNSGVPPTIGFIGKDLIYESALHSETMMTFLLGAAVLTKILLVVAGFLAGFKPFSGKLPDSLSNVHAPPVGMWISPAILAGMSLLFGLYPGLLENLLYIPGTEAVTGADFNGHLKLWHGFNFVLLLSAITIVSGLVIYFIIKPSEKLSNTFKPIEFLAPQNIILKGAELTQRFSVFFTNLFQNGYLRYYILTIMMFLILLVYYKMIKDVPFAIDLSSIGSVKVYEWVIMGLAVSGIIMILISRSRLFAVIASGIFGVSLCLVFIDYSAPDLAMTQFTIDTLTVVMFVLLLHKLPKYLPSAPFGFGKARDIAVSGLFGVFVTLLVLVVINQPLYREVSEYYGDNAYLLAKGKNVVNVILVDFRGIDTMIEITVLAIAALGVFGLLKIRSRKSKSNIKIGQ